mmetsp:Transcript_34455/g.82243  ORF Transcript_34455/g.82243 Transcript_34455/m.82243 type:complete len:270 (-) Transcript_34455:292-1101(-)
MFDGMNFFPLLSGITCFNLSCLIINSKRSGAFGMSTLMSSMHSSRNATVSSNCSFVSRNGLLRRMLTIRPAILRRSSSPPSVSNASSKMRWHTKSCLDGLRSSLMHSIASFLSSMLRNSRTIDLMLFVIFSSVSDSSTPPSSAEGCHVLRLISSSLACRAASMARCLITSGSCSCSVCSTSRRASASTSTDPHAPATTAVFVFPPSDGKWLALPSWLRILPDDAAMRDFSRSRQLVLTAGAAAAAAAEAGFALSSAAFFALSSASFRAL